MDDRSLPDEVRRLIDGALASMDHVEVLFRIAEQGDASAESLARHAHIEPSQLAKVLEDLKRAKLIANDGASYFVTQSPRDRAAVEELAAAYNARPMTLIRAVYARRSPLRSFADAFRLRRED